MSVVDILLTFFATIGKLMLAPFTKYDMLWIVVPVYLNWVFTEFYQEKKGTSVGNAITNGFVALWVGIDWSRTTIEFLTQKTAKFITAAPKSIVAFLMIAYGITIIVLGVKGKKAIKFIGRIREVTYLTVMLTPIFYGVVQPTFTTILSIIVFFPIFYGIVELVDYFIPTPAVAYEEDEKTPSLETPSLASLELPSSHPSEPFTSTSQSSQYTQGTTSGYAQDYPQSTYPPTQPSQYPASQYPPQY